MEQQAALAGGIFLIAYALIIAEKINRTIIAMIGGLMMIALGIVTQESALHHIDFNTLGLLAGMMIIVAITGKTGIFSYIAIAAAKKAKGDPIKILIYLGLITAVFSAFLDNVTTVLLMVPITFTITRKLKINPEPYLITQILASNIGGTSTLIGDPPNIMIGSVVQELSFMDFINNLALISTLILLVTIAILIVFYRKKIRTTDELKASLMILDEIEEIKDRKLLKTCFIVLGLTILGFFSHQIFDLESATIALSGAFILLLFTSKTDYDLEHAFYKVEWSTLFFFIGLFVLVGGLIDTGIIGYLARLAIKFTGGDTLITSTLIIWLSAVASAFIDNIPFVATMIPLIQDIGSRGVSNMETLWWSLSLGACLGGNGSLIGSSANLIVAGLAAQQGCKISFMRFLLIGFPLMVISIIIANIYIYLRYF
ncbi:Citrate transporter [Desulfofarcimen acetoxidans DSM 771]|jgi:Na+/H+ antiporter NhaD/arsenite permease-like protein|uniref:Citrate transporter n=1 Tax=Desulfofarcimen acetoxidans (strain ATCC 49208 / DSM 771 / KCTC 5769 / VKM B-1644 / 5575) TaxID=485916 RepID=C8W4I5_DESAS|nr:ArsB/NhaD family transporter [Desulfofarcimen acetoxidans]ACV63871.1 Citrate transporter [Desulfofarcimen acetoxidans DSM 771]